MRIAFLSSLLLLASMSQGAFGALEYKVQTDGTGAFIDGGWIGDGTVQANGGATYPSGTPLIVGFSSGTLDLGDVTGFGAPLIEPPDISTTMTISLAGTSPSADLNTNSNWPPEVSGLNITNLSGVSSLTVEFNWSEPLAAAFSSLPASNQPYLASVRRQGSPTADVTATYLGLRYTTDGTTFFGGLPGSAVGVDGTQSENTWSTDGASSSWSETGGWQHISLFDLDGLPYDNSVTDAIMQDEEQVYATGIRYTIVPTGGGFLDGANFLFSTNGGQYADTIAGTRAFVFVPEPGTVLLLALGLLPILLLRRRKRER